jgi:hypothetical protein
VSWRAGAKLFREIWPLIQVHIPDQEFRFEFERDLLHFFLDCDVDPTDLQGFHQDIDRALEGLGECQE